MIEIKNLKKSFGGQKIFEDFSLTINYGEFVIIFGDSGVGKTTLLNIIGYLEPYDGGEVLIDGTELMKIKQ